MSSSPQVYQLARVHFRDAAAEQTHSESAEVKQFASVLYPECLAPVEFIDCQLVTSRV